MSFHFLMSLCSSKSKLLGPGFSIRALRSSIINLLKGNKYNNDYLTWSINQMKCYHGSFSVQKKIHNLTCNSIGDLWIIKNLLRIITLKKTNKASIYMVQLCLKGLIFLNFHNHLYKSLKLQLKPSRKFN